MVWWKAVLLDMVCAAAVFGIIVFEVRSWQRRRTEMSWPVVSARVTALEQGPGYKNRSATYLRGEYQTGTDVHHFSVRWGLSDIETHTWVPPAGTPPIGATLLIHADPTDPSRVALEKAPAVRPTLGSALTSAVIALVLVGCGIVVWFI
jgi:hypothetical protein